MDQRVCQGRQGLGVYNILGYLISGIEYFYAYNWTQTIHSQLILDMKYTVVFLILVFYTSFSGILEGSFRVWRSTKLQIQRTSDLPQIHRLRNPLMH